MSGDHPNYSIVEIGQNTEKSPGDLRKLAVTQTLVRNHRLTSCQKLSRSAILLLLLIIIISKKKKKKKERICKIVDIAVLADHRIKLDLAREWKKTNKLWNMKVTIIPIVIGAFGTVTKRLLKGLEDLEVGGRVETI